MPEISSRELRGCKTFEEYKKLWEVTRCQETAVGIIVGATKFLQPFDLIPLSSEQFLRAAGMAVEQFNFYFLNRNHKNESVAFQVRHFTFSTGLSMIASSNFWFFQHKAIVVLGEEILNALCYEKSEIEKSEQTPKSVANFLTQLHASWATTPHSAAREEWDKIHKNLDTLTAPLIHALATWKLTGLLENSRTDLSGSIERELKIFLQGRGHVYDGSSVANLARSSAATAEEDAAITLYRIRIREEILDFDANPPLALPNSSPNAAI